MIINLRLADDTDTAGVSGSELNKAIPAPYEIKISSESINLFTIGIKYIEKKTNS